MPISAEEFEEGRSAEKKNLDEVMNPDEAYTTKEVADAIGRSWGIAKNALVAAKEEGKVSQKKVGRSIYWRLNPE